MSDADDDGDDPSVKTAIKRDTERKLKSNACFS